MNFKQLIHWARITVGIIIVSANVPNCVYGAPKDPSVTSTPGFVDTMVTRDTSFDMEKNLLIIKQNGQQDIRIHGIASEDYVDNLVYNIQFSLDSVANTEDVDSLKAEISDTLLNTDRKISHIDNKLERAGANAAALAGIHYQHMLPGESQIGAAIGHFSGKSALAIGGAYQLNNRVMVQMSGSACTNDYMLNLGATYKFGQHTKRQANTTINPGTLSLETLENQSIIKSLQFKNNEQAQQIAALQAEKDSQAQLLLHQEERIARLEEIVAKLSKANNIN